MLSPEKGDRGVIESKVKVTLNATATSEPIRKYFTTVFIEPGQESRARRPGFV
jgi:hypothetical protein